MKAARSCIRLLFLPAAVLLGVCHLPPRPVVVGRSALGAGTLWVHGPNETAVRLFCRSVAATGCFEKIRCGSRPEEPADSALGAHPAGMARLSVDARVYQDRSDLWENSKQSLRYGTTGLRISRSSRVAFEVTAERGVKSYRGLWTEHGRVGVYAYLPVYTGLVGTMLGSTLDGALSGALLETECHRGDEKACAQYAVLLEDSLALHSGRFRRLLTRLGCYEGELL